MSRRAAILTTGIALVIGCLLATPFLIFHQRQWQFDSVRELVESHGGFMMFDMVDGNYVLDLHGDAATDDAMLALVPELSQLPTGFTLLGPGESRLFYVTIDDSTMTDVGFDALCTLPLMSVSLDCPNLTDRSADRLAELEQPYAIVSGTVPFSPDAIKRLQDSKPNTMLEPQNGG